MNKFPDFKLEDRDGNLFSLNDFSEKYLVIFFYPKDSTPGCTIESRAFSQAKDTLGKLGALPIGVSGGDQKSKQKFCDKQNLVIPMLTDLEFKLSKELGIYGEKSFMGKKYLGITRTTYILNENREVIKIFDTVKPVSHLKEVTEFLENQG